MKKRTVRGEGSGGAAAPPPGRARGLVRLRRGGPRACVPALSLSKGASAGALLASRQASPRTKRRGRMYAQIPRRGVWSGTRPFINFIAGGSRPAAPAGRFWETEDFGRRGHVAGWLLRKVRPRLATGAPGREPCPGAARTGRRSSPGQAAPATPFRPLRDSRNSELGSGSGATARSRPGGKRTPLPPPCVLR